MGTAQERSTWPIWIRRSKCSADITRDEADRLSFTLHGHKLSGGFGLTRTGERRWILVKARDEHARAGSDIVAEQPASVRSGRTWQEVADGHPPDDGH